jgi:acetyltransferase-like isoleucine patch superfamily enzyme
MPLERKAAYELEMPKERRQETLLSGYDLDLRAQNVRMKIGRFSSSIINTIKFLPSAGDEVVLDVGCFCEAAFNAKILVGGNHQNDRLFNYTFSSGFIFRRMMDDAGRSLCDVAPSKPIVIGDNVVLSDGTTVTPGARIGSGSVIGAGAVVAGNLGPLGIYGGVPAKLIKPRLDAGKAAVYESVRLSNIAAHSVTSLPGAMARLDRGDINLTQLESELDFLDTRPVIEMTIASRSNSDRGIQLGAITGYRIGDTPIVDEAAVQKLNSYFAQIHSNQPKVKWVPDIFDALGLYGPGETQSI